MKGQYRVINELLLFGIGAFLAIGVAAIITTLIIPIQTQAQRIQYYAIGNLVMLAAAKTYLCSEFGNCTLKVDIPERLSEDRYEIFLIQPEIKIYNMRTRKELSLPTIFFEKTLKGFATSSGRYFIFRGGDEIILSKW